LSVNRRKNNTSTNDIPTQQQEEDNMERSEMNDTPGLVADMPAGCTSIISNPVYQSEELNRRLQKIKEGWGRPLSGLINPI
jgi:hypothetical protein